MYDRALAENEAANRGHGRIGRAKLWPCLLPSDRRCNRKNWPRTFWRKRPRNRFATPGGKSRTCGGGETAMVESFPTTMVMEEMPKPRETFVLIARRVRQARRAASRRGARQFAAVAGRRRRTIGWVLPAGWFRRRTRSRPASPSTAIWQMLFGDGLVKTVGDFGSQGEAPSHPELLDWLATEFIAHRLGHEGAAATVRDQRDLSPESHGRPPTCCVAIRRTGSWRAARGATGGRDDSRSGVGRQRTAGRTDRRAVGQAVSAGRTCGRTAASQEYEQDHGESLYRRSMYTFWKRTVAPPTMIDVRRRRRARPAPCGETRTNTPLQALALLNETTFVEAARMLAQRVMLEQQAPEARIDVGVPPGHGPAAATAGTESSLRRLAGPSGTLPSRTRCRR